MNTRKMTALLTAIPLLFGSIAACSPQPGEPTTPSSMDSAPITAAEPDTPHPSASQPESEPEPMIPRPIQPDQERMMEVINTLCRVPRPIGSQAEHAAAEYLQEKLAEYGYEIEWETFSYNISRDTLMDRYRHVRSSSGEAFFTAALPGDNPDGESQNIIGRSPQESEKEKVLILSAHYDSTPDSIGVVDNAAGVAVVLEAAHILAEEDLPFAIRIVLLGGEEEILIGSRHHLMNMTLEENRRILGNITVDTLAYSREQGFVALTALVFPQEDTQTLAENSPVAAAFLKSTEVTPAFRSRLVGDYLAFAAAGIDSINLGQSMDDVMDTINSPKDTYDFLLPDLLPGSAELLVEGIRTLASQMEGG